MKKDFSFLLIFVLVMGLFIYPVQAGLMDFISDVTEAVGNVVQTVEQVANAIDSALGNDQVQNILTQIFPSESAQNIINTIGGIANIISNMGLNSQSISQIISQYGGGSSGQVVQALQQISQGASQVSAMSNQVLQIIANVGAASQSAGELLNQIASIVNDEDTQNFIQDLQEFNQNFQNVLGTAGEIAEATNQMSGLVGGLANDILNNLDSISNDEMIAMNDKIMTNIMETENIIAEKMGILEANSLETKKIAKEIIAKLRSNKGDMLEENLVSVTKKARIMQLEKELSRLEIKYRKGILEENKTEEQLLPLRKEIRDIRKKIFEIEFKGKIF